MKMTLGTQLRHLIELLDGAVEQAYIEEGLDYRPRYTPVVRALITSEPLTVNQIAAQAGITQPAATQTISLMTKKGLIEVKPSEKDGRQRVVRLSRKGKSLLKRLEACWQATAMAAESLDRELPNSLSETLSNALEALGKKPFLDRINEAKLKL